ncbi:hypothetical protein QE152_g1338 [Popillia japonica]|uniref:Recombination activating protein 1 n=1 Tax=Popillia japonica TaxID=7064 RepID=A0AAW1N6Y1_POPJA
MLLQVHHALEMIPCKKQKCSILTSTPVKEQLEQKEKEHGEKERKKQERKEIMSSVKRNLQLANEPKKHSKVQKSGSKSNDNIKCPGCSELFEDPPIEAWILHDATAGGMKPVVLISDVAASFVIYICES